MVGQYSRVMATCGVAAWPAWKEANFVIGRNLNGRLRLGHIGFQRECLATPIILF